MFNSRVAKAEFPTRPAVVARARISARAANRPLLKIASSRFLPSSCACHFDRLQSYTILSIVTIDYKRCKEHHSAMKRDVTLSIRVSVEQKAELDEIAKSEHRAVSQLAYFLVEEGLGRRRNKAAKRAKNKSKIEE